MSTERNDLLKSIGFSKELIDAVNEYMPFEYPCKIEEPALNHLIGFTKPNTSSSVSVSQTKLGVTSIILNQKQ